MSERSWPQFSWTSTLLIEYNIKKAKNAQLNTWNWQYVLSKPNVNVQKVLFQSHNCEMHKARIVQAAVNEGEFEELQHPSYPTKLSVTIIFSRK